MRRHARKSEPRARGGHQTPWLQKFSFVPIRPQSQVTGPSSYGSLGSPNMDLNYIYGLCVALLNIVGHRSIIQHLGLHLLALGISKESFPNLCWVITVINIRLTGSHSRRYLDTCVVFFHFPFPRVTLAKWTVRPGYCPLYKDKHAGGLNKAWT